MLSLTDCAERGLVPDGAVRLGIRRLLARRLDELAVNCQCDAEPVFAEQLRQAPLAVVTEAANAQHYEVSPDFFQRVLGPRLKYSSCYFETAEDSLASAEEQMLQLTCQRAEIADGMRILELGCGWGSLTLWLAEHYPTARITAVSNSHSQRQFIDAQAASRGLPGIEVITADMVDFEASGEFDRVVSVEMFEHMRNYEMLLQRVSQWLTPQGKAFVHIFCHRSQPYLFQSEGQDNWMGRNFFTGGTMPSEHLFHQFSTHLKIEKQWRVNGFHYWRTCEAWLANLDRQRDELLACFGAEISPREAQRYLQRWRMFFMACAELFRHAGGSEWFVAHYLFARA